MRQIYELSNHAQHSLNLRASYGHGGISLIGVIVIILVVLLLTGRL